MPVAVQDGCIQVAFMFITVIANHRGLVDAAAVGLVEKMISFLFIVPSSMGRHRQRTHGAKRRRGQG